MNKTVATALGVVLLVWGANAISDGHRYVGGSLLGLFVALVIGRMENTR